MSTPSKAGFEIHILILSKSTQLSCAYWTLLVVNYKRREWRWGGGDWGKEKGIRGRGGGGVGRQRGTSLWVMETADARLLDCRTALLVFFYCPVIQPHYMWRTFNSLWKHLLYFLMGHSVESMPNMFFLCVHATLSDRLTRVHFLIPPYTDSFAFLFLDYFIHLDFCAFRFNFKIHVLYVYIYNVCIDYLLINL